MQANRTESNEIEIKITFGMCVRCHGAIEPSSSGAIGHWILPSSSWQLCKHISLGKLVQEYDALRRLFVCFLFQQRK